MTLDDNVMAKAEAIVQYLVSRIHWSRTNVQHIQYKPN